jgi:hypothetical protein
MTRTQYLTRRWRRHAYAWLDAHDMTPRTALALAAVLTVVVLYIGQRMGA